MSTLSTLLPFGVRGAERWRLARDIAGRAIPPAVVLAVILIAWRITSLFVNPLLVSSPEEVAGDLGWLFTHSALWDALAVSLEEMVIGAVIGLAVGLLLGLAMFRSRSLEAVLMPFVNFFNATPLVVVLPLLVIWVGITMRARVLFVVLITLWPMLLNTMAGLRNVPRGYVDVGASAGLSRTQVLWKLRLPAAAPYILTGARIAGGLAIIGMIVSEMEVSFTGVGWLLMNFGQNFDTGRLLALVVITCCFGLGNVALVKSVQRRFFPWISAMSA